MSATRPWTSSPRLIRSPIRIGWRIAISTPATKLAITAWAAKPMIRPSTRGRGQQRGRQPRLISVNWLSASATPMTMMATKTRRRTRRSRVRASRENCEVSIASVARSALPSRKRSTSRARTTAAIRMIAASISFPWLSQKLSSTAMGVFPPR